MKKLIIKKLDKRHRGSGEWKYLVERPRITYNQQHTLHQANQRFHEWREWCWDNWGPSKNITDWMEDRFESEGNLKCQNEHWSWQRDQYESRIYLRSDQEMVAFKLRWDCV